LFSRRAVLARAAAGIDPEDAHMAVLIQPQLSPELSFVLHTRHPLTGEKNSILAEIAPGHGETLASGTRGSGWRLTVTENGVVRHQQTNNVLLQTMDYSRQDLSRSQDYREQLGSKLRVVGQLLEKVFDCPQDVEGCIVNNEIYIVQTRPQP
jgi:phosphoglucan,water dikinase